MSECGGKGGRENHYRSQFVSSKQNYGGESVEETEKKMTVDKRESIQSECGGRNICLGFVKKISMEFL